MGLGFYSLDPFIFNIMKELTLKDIEAAIEKVGLDKDLELINKAMILNREKLIKDFRGIDVVDVERFKYYVPNGVEITFKKE